jgi:serine/threonine-protein kinase
MDPLTFGPYRNLRKLPGGGMARVYLADEPQMQRTVFLKLIDAATDEDGREVIEAERRGAALQGQLAEREPARVAKIYAAGDLEGYFFIAMEYVEGEDLSEIIRRGPIEPNRAVEITMEILTVLVRAHGFQAWVQDREYRGIIHGDIKPRNIRITTSGQVKLLDFGIAKAISATRGKTQNYFASARYSSPQRLETGEVDAPADLWSVATVLFEMVTSKPYFDAVDVPRLESTIRRYDSLKQTIMLLPPGLREVVRRALDPDPRKRFQTAAEFQAALRNPSARSGQQSAPEDTEATRRTTPTPTSPEKSGTSTATSRPNPMPRPQPGIAGMGPIPANLKIGAIVAAFLVLVFLCIYEIRMGRNADSLRAQIESGQVSVDAAEKALATLERQARLPAPIFRARNALRDRYVAEAERVIAGYRSFSPGAPVSFKDWSRANDVLAKAIRISPDDRTIRGEKHLVLGHVKLRYRQPDTKGALADFEDARSLLKDSADPHLGLALVHLTSGELDRAEEEYGLAAKYGYHPGRLQQQSLAEAYKRRGERWIAAAKRAHDIAKMQEAYQHADTDLEKAQGLYAATAPYGLDQAERIAAERRDVQSKLSNAQLAAPAGGTDGRHPI